MIQYQSLYFVITLPKTISQVEKAKRKQGKPKENTGETVEGESTETAAEKLTEKPEKDVGSYDV